MAQLSSGDTAPQVRTADGILEGVNAPGLSIFKGIPFAAPPIALLRWKEPQPVQPWKGIRKADKFGPRAMQRPIYSDMMFRSDGVGEDCLYLNVWTPAHSAEERLPVLVYFYGGGLMAGDGSEYRYDGENMARKGIVALTVNYRLGIFGFMAHPELTKESPHHASGNYGYMDQAAALQWVKKNIAAFGGDPNKITIAGESAGSSSVSALMASPLSRTLISGAIGESGSLLGSPTLTPLAEAEQKGLRLQELADVHSLLELRRIPAEKLQQIATNHEREIFTTDVDGYFFPTSPQDIYAAGQQAQVPLLVGWNSQENDYRSILGNEIATVDNYTKAVQRLYGDKAADVLKVYAAAADADVKQVATYLAGDRFIGFATWKWSDIQSLTGGKPVYRYMYCHPRPRTNSDLVTAIPPPAGAVHSAEIEYAMGNLSTNPVYAWQPEDYKVSELMQSYFANFIKTGNPNGPGIPVWHPVKSSGPAQVMFIDVNTREETEKHRDRYLLLDQLLLKK
jgi:para-nitrobenzyl esterase